MKWAAVYSTASGFLTGLRHHQLLQRLQRRVSHEIVAMTYTCAPIGPIPCDEVDSVFTLNSGQHSAIEIGQHLVAVL